MLAAAKWARVGRQLPAPPNRPQRRTRRPSPGRGRLVKTARCRCANGSVFHVARQLRTLSLGKEPVYWLELTDMLGQPCTVACTIRRLDETRQYGTNSALSGPILSVDRVAPSPHPRPTVIGRRATGITASLRVRRPSSTAAAITAGLRGVTPLIRAKSSALSWRSLLERSAFVEHGVDGSEGSVTAPDPRDDARRRSARSAGYSSGGRRGGTMVVGAVRNRALFWVWQGPPGALQRAPRAVAAFKHVPTAFHPRRPGGHTRIVA